MFIVSEEKFLQQLAVEEQFGPVEKTEPQPIEGKKKVPGAAIGYNYEEGSSGSTNVLSESNTTNASNDAEGDDNEEEEDSDIDFGKHKSILGLLRMHFVTHLYIC